MAEETLLSDAALVGELLKGCYQIEERVGKGGMAWVYRATHTMLLETVAVKILFSQHASEPEPRERFLREARLQARVKHPHIVRVTDFIDERGVVGLVQEWIEGGDLQAWIEQHPEPLSPQEVAMLMLPVIDAVGHAHNEGVIHRDLKPSNIMLVPQNSWLPIPKLADFGLARQQETQGLTATNSSMGTPLYMAPEQFMSAKDVDQRADIYSIGVILYQLSSGQLPFYGELNSLVYQVFHEERKPPPNVEGPLASLILKCIDKSPAKRFASCEALAQRLQEVCLTQESDNTLTDLEQVSEEDLPSGLYEPLEDDPDNILAHAAIEASEAPTRREQRSERPIRRPKRTERTEHQAAPVGPSQTPSREAGAAVSEQHQASSNKGLLLALLLVLAVVGGVAVWGIRNAPSAQSHASKEPLQSDGGASPLTGGSGYPVRRRPPPRSRTTPRTPSLGLPPARALANTAKARRLLLAVQRAYGGRKAVMSVKKMFFRGRLIKYRRRGAETFAIACFARYPAHQRIELEGSDGQRHVQIVSPTMASLTTGGRTKALPRRAASDVLRRHILGTMEFLPASKLAQVRLGRPSWIGSRKVERLLLTDHGGHSVALLVDRRRHLILKREYTLHGARYAYFYTRFRFHSVPVARLKVLFPMRQEIYKDGRRHRFLQLHTLRPNAPEVQDALFK